jgi:hypothetical protein
LDFAYPVVSYPAAHPVYLVVSGSDIKIPSGHTVRLKQPITESIRDDIHAPEPLLVQYCCTSSIQELAGEAQSRLYVYVPERYWHLIPAMEVPAWETPLQPLTPPPAKP